MQRGQVGCEQTGPQRVFPTYIEQEGLPLPHLWGSCHEVTEGGYPKQHLPEP
jgi:hypothetical protein